MIDRLDIDVLFLAVTVGGLAGGGVARLFDSTSVADGFWLAVTLLAIVPAAVWVAQGLRRGQLGADVIAVLALVGTVAVRAYLAGAVVGVMVATGRVLERRAERRARKDLSSLVSLAPRLAHRDDGGNITTVPVSEIWPGDRLIVRSGEAVPVDGQIETGAAFLDESLITGEPLPAERLPGDSVRSGSVSVGNAFGMRATVDAAASTYEQIARLARDAEANAAPFVRLADRYAAWFLPLTLLIAGGAWAASRDFVRAVAVLVVATPCPLILAAPIAFVSGLGRAARRGVIVKGGSTLERLGAARVLLFDKTGTVTGGRPTISEVIPAASFDAAEVLRLAASLDQMSVHTLAATIVAEARRRQLTLSPPRELREEHGTGVRGLIDGRTVTVGKAEWAFDEDSQAWAASVRDRAATRGSATVFVGVDDEPAGALLLDDPIRADTARTFRLLRRAGIEKAIMLTGDRPEVAASVAALIGVDDVRASLTPADKVAAVREESRHAPTVMVGDGVNDAPALATAGVGVAMAARGATVASHAADIVITVDRLERLAEALAIAHRTRRIAWQSVIAGMGMSLAAMIIAALGWLPPVAGAILQEGIDVVVILNALRAMGPGRTRGRTLHDDEAELMRRLDDEHGTLRPKVEQLRDVAEALATTAPADVMPSLREVTAFVTGELARHERDDEALLYPAVARVLGGEDPMGAMSRGHAEIAELARRLETLVATLPAEGPDPRSLLELQGLLHQLYAVVRLHFAQEEEHFSTIAP